MKKNCCSLLLVWFFCVYPPIKNISTTFFLYCTLHKTIYAEICRMHQYWGYSGKFCIIIKKTLSLSVSLSLSLPRNIFATTFRASRTVLSTTTNAQIEFIFPRITRMHVQQNLLPLQVNETSVYHFSLSVSILWAICSHCWFRIQSEWSLTMLIFLLMDVRKITKIYTKKQLFFSSISE